jgi:hypothetical protein
MVVKAGPFRLPPRTSGVYVLASPLSHPPEVPTLYAGPLALPLHALIHQVPGRGILGTSPVRRSTKVRLTVYCGTTATASISTKKSGCARPETNTPVIAGGLGTSGQAF